MLRVGPRAVLTETRSSGRPAAEIHPNEGLPGEKYGANKALLALSRENSARRWIRILRQ